MKKARVVSFLSLLGAMAGAAGVPYSQALMRIPPEIGIKMYTMSIVQTTAMVFLAAWIGIAAADRVGLKTPILRRILYGAPLGTGWARGLVTALAGSVLLALLVVGLDGLLFAPLIDGQNHVPLIPDWWKGLLASFSAGIVEEVLLRLCLMSLLVWIFCRLRGPKGFEKPVPASFYWTALILSAVLFGLGHLPAAHAVFGHLSFPIVLRTVVLNVLGGIWFGYLYWRKGLEYAMAAHVGADVLLHGLLPLFVAA